MIYFVTESSLQTSSWEGGRGWGLFRLQSEVSPLPPRYLHVDCPGNDSACACACMRHTHCFLFHTHLCGCSACGHTVCVCVHASLWAACVSVTLSVRVPVFMHPCTCVCVCSLLVGTASPPLASTRYVLLFWAPSSSSYWAVVEQARGLFLLLYFLAQLLHFPGSHVLKHT